MFARNSLRDDAPEGARSHRAIPEDFRVVVESHAVAYNLGALCPGNATDSSSSIRSRIV